jgi:hypothetical protein
MLALAVALTGSNALSAAPKAKRPSAPASLDGTWITTVALVNPPPGIDATFQALDTFVAGGGILVSSSQSHPAARSLAHGNCSHSTGLRYACTFVWFRFDQAGAPIGMARVRRTMTVSADRSSFQATDTIEMLAPDGTVVASLHGTETGHKLGA